MDFADMVCPPKAEATTLVPVVGVGGGRGLSVRNNGCICDSLEFMDGTDRLRRRKFFGFSILGASGECEHTERLRAAALCRCGDIPGVLFFGNGGLSIPAQEFGRLPGMGSSLVAAVQTVRTGLPRFDGLAVASDAKCLYRVISGAGNGMQWVSGSGAAFGISAVIDED